MATKAKPPALPDAEVQALADLALRAWENGRELARVDSLGGSWTFLAERTPEARLLLTRRVREEDPRTSYLSGLELGAEATAPVTVASRILALAVPAS
jgi:hypothetical protein